MIVEVQMRMYCWGWQGASTSEGGKCFIIDFASLITLRECIIQLCVGRGSTQTVELDGCQGVSRESLIQQLQMQRYVCNQVEADPAQCK